MRGAERLPAPPANWLDFGPRSPISGPAAPRAARLRRPCQRRRIRFSIPLDRWLDEATGLPGFEVVPIELPIVLTASRLTALRDPADMLIVATAQHHGARLVTSDARIQEGELVPFVA